MRCRVGTLTAAARRMLSWDGFAAAALSLIETSQVASDRRNDDAAGEKQLLDSMSPTRSSLFSGLHKLHVSASDV